MSYNKNRQLGHNAERKFAEIFRGLGFPKCKTSRYASRVYDDAGIDLIGVPYNIQIKAGVQKGMNPAKTLAYMDTRIKELLLESDAANDRMNLIIHETKGKSGKKRTMFSTLVYMALEDFILLSEEAKIFVENNISKIKTTNFRGFKFKEYLETLTYPQILIYKKPSHINNMYNILVVMPFEVFVKIGRIKKNFN